MPGVLGQTVRATGNMKLKPVVSPIVLADIALVKMTSFLLAVGEAAVGVAGLRAHSVIVLVHDA